MDASDTFTLILTGIGIFAALLKGVQWVMVSTLVKYGLVRPGRRGQEDASSAWPNDYHSLPDTLAGLYAALQRFDSKP